MGSPLPGRGRGHPSELNIQELQSGKRREEKRTQLRTFPLTCLRGQVKQVSQTKTHMKKTYEVDVGAIWLAVKRLTAANASAVLTAVGIEQADLLQLEDETNPPLTPQQVYKAQD